MRSEINMPHDPVQTPQAPLPQDRQAEAARFLAELRRSQAARDAAARAQPTQQRASWLRRLRRPSWAAIFVTLAVLSYLGYIAYLFRNSSPGFFWGALAVFASPFVYMAIPGKLTTSNEGDDTGPTPTDTLNDPAYYNMLGNSWHDMMEDTTTDPAYSWMSCNVWHDTLD